jgi:hypothetical protein
MNIELYNNKNNNDNMNNNDNIKFLQLQSHHKIEFNNLNNIKLLIFFNNIYNYIFNNIYNYISTQFFYIETLQNDKCDTNIKNMYCCDNLDDYYDNDNSDNSDNSDNLIMTNTVYNIDNINFKGKSICEFHKNITNMNIGIKYSIPAIFKNQVEEDCSDGENTITVEYIIKTNRKNCDKTIVRDTYINEFNKISFYPKNKLSFKYFDIFLSCIMNYSKKDKLYLKTPSRKITIYINMEHYWEELFDRPSRDIDSIYLLKEDKTRIIDDITWFLKPETQLRYEELGRNYKRVFLFEGIPGSGKTSLALAIASYFGYDIAILNFTDKVTDGTFTRLIQQLPEKTILLLEDIDCLFHERKNEDTHKNYVTFSGILNTLDGIATPHEFLCIITTNYKNILDDALLRPGRIDTIIKFDYAKRSQIRDIYKAYMGSSYDSDSFITFYNSYKELNVECSVSLIQEYLFKYLDNPSGAVDNIYEIKDLKENSSKAKANVYM